MSFASPSTKSGPILAANLELLASPPGTGKTTYCIELFREQILRSKGGIDSRSFFVLPSREHAERIQNLILKKELPGLFNAHIVTINDLATRLLDVPPPRQRRGRARPVASRQAGALPTPSEALRQRIIREILNGPLDFKYFEASRQLPGFHRLCSEMIKELKSGLLSIVEFEKRAQPLLKSPVFRSKFRDFSVLVKNYEKRLAQAGYAEPEDTIGQLVETQLKTGELDLVVMDGFYHFSRAQRELIRRLTRLARNVVVSLTVSGTTGGRSATRAPADLRSDLFYYPERTRAFLLSLGFRQKDGVFAVKHRSQSPALAHLEEHLFSKNPLRFAGDTGDLAVLEAPDARGEIEMIAREIRRLAREKPLYLSDICVILRSVSPYQKIIASVFDRFGIPVHIHERYKLKETALGVFLYRFLGLSASGWKRADVFYVLKSGLLSSSEATLEELLHFERISASLGVLDGKQAWLALAANKTVSEAVRLALEELVAAENRLLAAKSARAFTAALRAFISGLGASETAASGSVEELLRSMERTAECARKSAFDPGFAALELGALIESALLSMKPQGKNRVQVYDAVMALPKEYKVVFVSGLLERVFPQSCAEDAFFKDQERQVINRRDIALEESAFRIAGERYFFYMALARSREKIYLTYPLYDSDQRACLPSFFVEEVRRCFEKEIPTKTRALGDFLPAPGEWETLKEVTRGLADILGSGADLTSAPTAMRPWLERDDLKEVLKWAQRGELDASITDARAVKLFAQNRGPFSATRLEVMAACAFRHFASEVLDLKEPPDGRESMEMGTALHKTLETYFKSLTVKARKTGSYVEDPQRMKNELKKSLLPIAMESPLSRGRPYRFQMQVRIMQRSLELFADNEKELFDKRGLAASEFELRFGYLPAGRQAASKMELGFLEIQAGSGAIPIRGQIDRLDVSPDGKSALVADYKLSKRPSVHKKLGLGLELQLPIYLLAARRLLGYEVIGAEHRYLKEPARQGIYREDAREILKLSARETVYTEEEFEEVLAKTEERIRDLVSRIGRADISVRPRSCEFCHFSPVCRFEPWRLVYAEEPQ